jgi:predicted ATPase
MSVSSNNGRHSRCRSLTLNRFVVISGCSGGGKSSLLAELHRRGHTVVEEPGRRVVKQEMENRGLALPWTDKIAFVRRVLEMALADWTFAHVYEGWVFFDRGIIDAAAGLEHLTGEPVPATLELSHRYHRRIFLTPPWPEIYITDLERRHGLDEALAEYFRLLKVYPSLGYEASLLPKIGISERADFLLNSLVS